jgi:hypothetical protein
MATAAAAASTKVTLETSDKEQFSVDKEVAERSVLLKNMLEGQSFALSSFTQSYTASDLPSFFLA